MQVYLWNGVHGKGAMRIHRVNKRREAEYRNAATLPENRRQARLARERNARDRKAARKAMKAAGRDARG